MVIVDKRQPYVDSIGAGYMTWTLGSESAEVGVDGTVVRAPMNQRVENCGWGQHSASATFPPAAESLTHVLFAAAPKSWVTLHATWTYGVGSYDFAIGDHTIKRKGELDRGVHASYYPLPTSATVGLFRSETIVAPRDSIGWWWPNGNFATGPSWASCRQNGSTCQGTTSPSGYTVLAGDGPTTWDFAVDAEIRAQERPYYALALADPPDDTFLD